MGLSFSSLAQDEVGGSKIVESSKDLDVLTKYTQEDQEVIAAMDACEQDGKTGDQMMDCIWEPGRLSDEKKQEIYDALNFGQEEESNYTPTVSNFKTQDSLAIKALEKYMQERLEKALIDDSDPKAIKAVEDHTVFLRIYKSQLGKNLITELASYCIYSDPETGYVPKADGQLLAYYKSQNEANLTQTTTINATSGEEGSKAYGGFNQCITRIAPECRGDNPRPSNMLAIDPNFSGSPEELPISACELNRLMTGVKNAIAATDEIIETFDELNEDNKNHSLVVGNVTRKKINVNAIVNIGSKELVADSGYKQELENIAQDIKDKCADQAALISEECKKYFTSKEDNEKLALEFDFRNKAIEEKVKADIAAANNDIEVLKKIYKDQGLSDEEFENLVANVPAGEDPFDYLQKKITKQYENERDDLKESLNKKLQASQVDYQDQAQNNPTKGTELAQQYESSAESLAKVYQYANIVSSFIEVSSGGQKTRNTAALAAELDSNYFSADQSGNRGVASGSPAPVVNLDNLQGFAGDIDDGSDDSDFVETSLDVQDINQMQWKGTKGKDQ